MSKENETVEKRNINWEDRCDRDNIDGMLASCSQYFRYPQQADSCLDVGTGRSPGWPDGSVQVWIYAGGVRGDDKRMYSGTDPAAYGCSYGQGGDGGWACVDFFGNLYGGKNLSGSFCAQHGVDFAVFWSFTGASPCRTQHKTSLSAVSFSGMAVGTGIDLLRHKWERPTLY